MSDSDDLETQLKTTKKKTTKKKKKVTVDSDDEDGAAPAEVAPQRERPTEANADAVSPEPAGQDGGKVPALLVAQEPEDPTLEEFYAQLKKEKKARKRTGDEEETAASKVKVECDLDALQKTDRDLTYQEMLALAIDAIKGRGGKVRDEPVRFRPPQVVRDGTKKVVWTNFPDICQRLNRAEDHLFAFALSELGTTGRLDGNHCFVLKGRFTDKHLEGLLRKYVTAYVACQMCRSLGTQLVKDPHSRLTTLNCDQCGANRTVQSITSGFSAQIGRRKRK